jgi:putative SOS response-associated peptidase YedK
MFGIEGEQEDIIARYNVAPSQGILVARIAPGGGRELARLRWGLVPSWSKGPDSRFSMINARAETVIRKPAYRAPFRYRRCLIPTEGFYEWKPEKKYKQPYYIRLRSREPFALAGLWDHWQDAEGNEIESCTIIVTEANALVRTVHDRMPVILPPKRWDAWLDPRNQETADLASHLVPYDAEAMEAVAVSRAVGNPKNEGRSLIEPIAES